MMDAERCMFALSEFCREERVYRGTVLRIWRDSGQAPDLTRINGRYFVSATAWAKWLHLRQADRTRTGNPGLRAPLARTPKTTNGKIKWAPSVEGL